MNSECTLHTVPDDELLRRLGELVSHSRRVEADLVAHIGEVEERRLYAREATPSMFVYCTERLHLSEAEAYRRITVARAARKHDVLLAMLRDGRLHLTGIAMLAPLLTPENRDAVLARATHLSKRQLEELVAELSPRPDTPSVIRKLPDGRKPRPAVALEGQPQARCEAREPAPHRATGALELVPDRDGAAATPTATAPSPDLAQPVTPFIASGLAMPFAPPLASSSVSVPPRTASLPPRIAVVQPLSPGRYKVQFTASAELRDKLERLSALMRSEVPDGDLAAIIERAVTEKLERLEARRYAQSRAPHKKLGDTDHITSVASHSCCRTPCRTRTRRRPLSLRRRAGSTLLRPGSAGVPSPAPLRHGRRSPSREHSPLVLSPQPLPGRARLRPFGDQPAPAIGQAGSPLTVC